MSTQNYDNTIEWSLATYYYVVAISIFNIVLFTLLLISMASLPPKYRNALKENRAAVIFWINSIVLAILSVFFNTSIIKDFGSECVNQDRSCKRCTITGHLHHFLIMVSLVCRLFVILRILEINIQQFPILAYPRKLIIGIKILFWVLFISVNVSFIGLIPMRVHLLEKDRSVQICTISSDDDTIQDHNKVMGIFAPVFLVSHVILCVLFIRKVAILYQMIKKKLLISPDTIKKTKEGLIMMHNVIKPIIKHTLLVVTITLAHVIVVIKRVSDPEGFPIYPVEHLIVGLCIVMMFKFGQGYFRFFCHCLERPIIQKWMRLESENINKKAYESNTESTTNSRDKQNEINCNDIPLQIEEDSQLTLPQIEENTEFNSSTIPVFSKWSLFTIESEQADDFQPESVTRSDMLAAIKEFDF